MRQLLVYESSPLNAALFARLANVELREVRSLNQLEEAIAGQPAPQVVAVEVTLANMTKVVDLIHRAKSLTRAAVIAMPDATVHVGVRSLYEAGTDLVFRSMLDRSKAGTLIRNKIRIHERASRIREHDDFRSQIWSTLPWKKRATA